MTPCGSRTLLGDFDLRGAATVFPRDSGADEAEAVVDDPESGTTEVEWEGGGGGGG